AALTPLFADGLRAVLRAPLRVDVVSRSDADVAHRSIAWSHGRTVSLSHRSPAGTPTGRQPALQLTLAPDDDLGHELRQDLPSLAGHHGTATGATPVRVGWSGAAATAEAVREG